MGDTMRYGDDSGDEHEKMMARKVDVSWFVWAIGLLSTVMFLETAWCFNEISNLRQTTAATDARVYTYIDQGAISTQDLKLSLEKVKTDVEWIRRQLDARSAPSR